MLFFRNSFPIKKRININGSYIGKSGVVKGQELGGITKYNFANRTSDVYFSKGVFSSHDLLFFTMQHEYVHVAFNYNGFNGYMNNQEVAASVSRSVVGSLFSVG